IGAGMLFAGDFSVTFTGPGDAHFVTWQVGSSAVIEQHATVVGNMLVDQSISLNAGATVNGRLLARIAAVAMIKNTITKPGFQSAQEERKNLRAE
ncbi:hypothetical protein B484DRAFT_411356, partial [Ochromonadaceae sp. CCMP2298]